MRRTANEIIRNLEQRIARLENKLARRPTMSPRRQVEEGLFESEDYSNEKDFEAFALNSRSILKFIESKPKLRLKGNRILAVNVSAYQRSVADIHILAVSKRDNYDEAVIYTIDVDVTSSGNILKVMFEEYRDINSSEYKRIIKRPVDVSIDEESLQRSFKNYIFKR
tara:strand:+ start:40 stop:540 length:501 start_codon:yes stop_codon:yes gene_type:complete